MSEDFTRKGIENEKLRKKLMIDLRHVPCSSTPAQRYRVTGNIDGSTPNKAPPYDPLILALIAFQFLISLPNLEIISFPHA